MDALLDASSLKLRHRRKDPRNQAACGARGVDGLAQCHEGNSKGLPLVKQHHQMAQVAPQPIELPADHGINPAPPDCLNECVEGRAATLRAADAVIDKLYRTPSASLGVL